MYTIVSSDEAIESMSGIVATHLLRRDEFQAALRSIAETLHLDPNDVGESRADGWRVEFFSPLVVHFLVDEEDTVVEILTVALSQRL